MDLETDGPYEGALYRANALRCGWAILLEDTPNDDTFEAVRQKALSAEFVFDDATSHLKFNDCGSSTTGAFTCRDVPFACDWPGPAPHFTRQEV